MSQNTTNSQPQAAPIERPIWPDGVVHHGIRISLVLGLAVVVALLFPPVQTVDTQAYEVGQILDEDVIAEVTFDVPKPQDELIQEQREAASSVPPTFTLNRSVADSVFDRMSRFFDQLDAVADSTGATGVRELLASLSINVDSLDAERVVPAEARSELRSTGVVTARTLLREGVFVPGDVQDLSGRQIVRTDPERQVSESVPVTEVYVPAAYYDAMVDALESPDPVLARVLRLVAIRFFQPSLELDVFATANARNDARRSVPVTRETIYEREAVARGNQRLTEDDVHRLVSYEDLLRGAGRLETAEGGGIGLYFGAALLNVLLLGLYGLMLYFFRPGIYGSTRCLLLQTFLILVYFGTTKVVVGNAFPPELLPIAFVTLSVAVMWDSRMALVLGLVLSAVTATLPGLALPDALFATAVGGAAAAFSVRVVRRRAQTWVFIAIITAAYFAVLLANALLAGVPIPELGLSVVWAFSNAAVSGMIAMGMVPVYEWFTSITTDQTLLEYADPNHTLLRRLSLEAPGTYAHTINVANLGEMGANAIGANGLLCRVGLYYHDVGKVLKPHFFVENQPDGRNPHDKLKPRVSAGIVREHVTEGFRLGKEENLPQALLDFILEHHGTQLIGYFHAKAVEEEGEEAVDEADFRYPGPRPRSRETAISMMADSIESATRVLEDPTPERIRALVEGIIDSKIRDGQLDDSPLTLREITTLKETFVKVLSGVYHHRIDYPTTKHLTDAPDNGTGGEAEDGKATPSDESESTTDEQHQMDLDAPVEDPVR